jgi:hypothetical protein
MGVTMSHQGHRPEPRKSGGVRVTYLFLKNHEKSTSSISSPREGGQSSAAEKVRRAIAQQIKSEHP